MFLEGVMYESCSASTFLATCKGYSDIRDLKGYQAKSVDLCVQIASSYLENFYIAELRKASCFRVIGVEARAVSLTT